MKPSINIPFVDPELRRTLEAIKENLEIITGRRGGRLASLRNDAERWQDELCSLTFAKGGGGATTTPQWLAFRNGVYAWAFENNHTDEVWFSIHVTHLYKFGSPFHLHIHWAVAGALTGTCRWGIEYTVAKGHQQQAFPVTNTVYIEQALPSGVGADNQYMHMIAEMSDAQAIQASVGLEPDTLLLCRLFRDASHANDTINGDVFAFFADAHFQVDSHYTTTKRPDWVKNTDGHGAIFDKMNEVLDKLQ